MRNWLLPTHTGIGDLCLREAAMPRPGPGQALVRMHAASLNYRDYAVATGKYLMSALPNDLVPLSDGAGEVIETGPNVTRVKPGDRVAGIFMQGWLGGDMEPAFGTTALGGAIDGVLAEYKVFDETGLVHLPPHLSYAEGASLPCAAVTAWNALYGLKPLQPGQTVLVLGTGGVSMFALQFAAAAGARVIATSSSDEKLAKAVALGASGGINYRDHEDWQKQVRALTDGRGVDHVVEVGGPGTLQRSIAAVRLGGVVTLIGVLTRGTIDPLAILGGGAIVRGVFVGSRAMFEDMNRAIALAGIKPAIDREFAFADTPEAYRYLKAANHLGKIVISIP